MCTDAQRPVYTRQDEAPLSTAGDTEEERRRAAVSGDELTKKTHNKAIFIETHKLPPDLCFKTKDQSSTIDVITFDFP
ncbi:hypothetical protein F2Q68_00042099 [Brassica cretica]|uniref:Uncharacterized protein n=1 Tax=Brassica cretica TaxID=69181 RepID=A0A8S9M8X4_BRACR|nr:hypothetical protein F2Q68_00042099 [Brassica cretica]